MSTTVFIPDLHIIADITDPTGVIDITMATTDADITDAVTTGGVTMARATIAEAITVGTMGIGIGSSDIRM